MDRIIETLNAYVWSWPLVGLCLLAALYFSIGTRFVQVRHFGEMIRLLFYNDKSKREGISSFQAFALALSGRVGTGNIVGVAMAIGYGGPGAIVWMWIIAFLGAGTAFSEATLAQIYKERHGNQLRGGPAYYIEKGLRSRLMAIVFAVVTVLACSICLPPIHSNSIAASFATTFACPTWLVGLGVALLIALIIMGGVKRIAVVAEIITPFMAIIYVLLSLVILGIHYQSIPTVFGDMIRSAFGVHEVFGGIIGSAIAWGVKRGIYSNEAGQGTAPIVAAAAKVDHPVKQGLVQGFSVYIDTLLVCTATAVIILATKCYNVVDPATDTYLVSAANGELGEPGVAYTISALATVLGQRWGGIVISVTLFFFAFTTIMAYYYYAETNLIFIFSKMQERIHGEQEVKREKRLVWTLRILFVIAVLFGSLKEAKVIWSLGDLGVGMMTWINITVILLLSPKVFRTLRSYERAQKKGENPKFNPKELNIKNADFWEENLD